MQKCNVDINKNVVACSPTKSIFNLTKVHGNFVVRDENDKDITDKCSISEYCDQLVSVSAKIHNEIVSCTFEPTVIKYSPKFV